MIFSGAVGRFVARLGVQNFVNFVVGAKVLGWGALFHSEELGGWRETSLRDFIYNGYYKNPTDGKWYENASGDGGFGTNPLPDSMQDYVESVKTALDLISETGEDSLFYSIDALMKNVFNNFRNDESFGGVGNVDYSFDFKFPLNIDDFFKWLFPALNMVDPLVLDIDGDGINTTSAAESSAYFDFDGNGNRIKTGWISAGDGFLVIDRNRNQVID